MDYAEAGDEGIPAQKMPEWARRELQEAPCIDRQADLQLYYRYLGEGDTRRDGSFGMGGVER